jgi:hypothetical protein
MLTRRQVLVGIAAPAIIRVADLMHIKEWRENYVVSWYQRPDLTFKGRGLLIEEQKTNLLLNTYPVMNGWIRLTYVARRLTNEELNERLKVLPDDVKMLQIEQGDFVWCLSSFTPGQVSVVSTRRLIMHSYGWGSEMPSSNIYSAVQMILKESVRGGVKSFSLDFDNGQTGVGGKIEYRNGIVFHFWIQFDKTKPYGMSLTRSLTLYPYHRPGLWEELSKGQL